MNKILIYIYYIHSININIVQFLIRKFDIFNQYLFLKIISFIICFDKHIIFK